MTEQQTGIVQYKASDGSDVRLSPAIIGRYIVTGGQQVDDREVYAFMAKCQARHLNPLAGDAYMTAYKNKRTGRVETSVIVSKDYFVRTATQQPGFDGFKAGVVVASKSTGQLTYRDGCIVGANSETLVGGWAEVFDKGRSHPTRAEVSLSEYDQKRNLWTSKPATMIRKVALVQALRESYPGAYGGLYDGSEMPEERQATQAPMPVEVAPEVTGPEIAREPETANATAPHEDVTVPIRELFRDYQQARGGIDAAKASQELAQVMGVADMSAELTRDQVDGCVRAMRETIDAWRHQQARQADEYEAEQDAHAGDAEAMASDLYEEEVEF